jgi:hypothetical protein
MSYDGLIHLIEVCRLYKLLTLIYEVLIKIILYESITPNEMYLIMTKNYKFVVFFQAKILGIPYTKNLEVISRLRVLGNRLHTEVPQFRFICETPSYQAFPSRDIRNINIVHFDDEFFLNRCTGQSPTESDDIRCCIDTITPSEDKQRTARNM